MSVSHVERAHRIHQFCQEKPILDDVVHSETVRKAYRLGQKAIRFYNDLTGVRGRIEWDSPSELADQAIKRGAMQKQSEFESLLSLLAKNRPQSVMEIGTANGGTLFALAHVALDEAKITSVDLPNGDFGGGYTERGKKRIESYALPTQELGLFRADSHNPNTYAEVVDWLEDEPVDFLMIDGDHSRQGVVQDWEMYAPLVGPGGIIAFHDVAPHESDPKCQVSGFWQEIKQSHNTLEFIEQPATDGKGQWGGIGVVLAD